MKQKITAIALFFISAILGASYLVTPVFAASIYDDFSPPLTGSGRDFTCGTTTYNMFDNMPLEPSNFTNSNWAGFSSYEEMITSLDNTLSGEAGDFIVNASASGAGYPNFFWVDGNDFDNFLFDDYSPTGGMMQAGTSNPSVPVHIIESVGCVGDTYMMSSRQLSNGFAKLFAFTSSPAFDVAPVSWKFSANPIYPAGYEGYDFGIENIPNPPVYADTYGIITPEFDYTYNSTNLWVNVSTATTIPELQSILANVGSPGDLIQPFAQFVATGDGCTAFDDYQILSSFGAYVHFSYTWDGDCDYQINTGFAYTDTSGKATGESIVYTNAQGFVVQYTFLEAELSEDLVGTGYGNTLFPTRDGGINCSIPMSPYDPTSLGVFTYSCGFAPLSASDLCKYDTEIGLSQLACLFEASSREFSNYVIGNQFGLTAVITAPIAFLSEIAAGDYACTPVALPLPYMDESITVPCMTESIYSVHVPVLLLLWQGIATTVVLYYLTVRTLFLVKKSHDPNDDKIEVLKL